MNGNPHLVRILFLSQGDKEYYLHEFMVLFKAGANVALNRC